MRIVFLGKGGSGKTTVTSLLARCALARRKRLLTIDGDVNVHLGKALGVPIDLPSLGDDYQRLFQILEGRNPAYLRLGVAPECGSLPPSPWSHRVALTSEDPVLLRYAWKSPEREWWHLQLGNYGTVDHGGDCYHYKQNALELLVHRLLDRDEDLVLTDATAGVDHVATSLSLGYDLCVLSVEPTLKSVSVAKDFERLATSADIAFVFLANKLESPEDFAFLRDRLASERFVGQIPFSCGLGRSEQCDLELLDELAWKCSPILDALIERASEGFHRGRRQQLSRLAETYRKECASYWSAYHGVDLFAFLGDVETNRQAVGL